MRPLFCLSLLTCLLAACRPPSASTDRAPQLGTISLTVSGDQAAWPAFERGLLLLHSFEYEDAARAFREAQQQDPNFALAYWGEAMTHNHPLWRQQDRDSARAILARLAPTPAARRAKTTSPLEEDLLQSVEILYGEGSKAERDQAYADNLARLYRKYPESHEVRAFYALALLGSVNDGRDSEMYGQGAVIAQGILAENPNHPGALHYLIHAYDDPGHAAQAVLAADRYAEVAPDASHALHMPSHIYVALGRWADVVSSNEASWQASLSRKQRLDLDGDARGYHAFHWLLYGYLQQGRQADAAALLRDMRQYAHELPSRRTRTHLVLLHSTYLTDTGDWIGPEANVSVQTDDLSLTIRAQHAYVQGRQALVELDLSAAGKIIARLDSLIAADRLRIQQAAIAVCGRYDRRAPTQTSLNVATVLLHQLRALLADRLGDPQAAEQWLTRAVALEAETSYSYGPPDIVKPSPELYGEWLMAQRRPAEALEQFDAALARAPRRRPTMRGQLAALQALGKIEAAEMVEEELTVINEQRPMSSEQ